MGREKEIGEMTQPAIRSYPRVMALGLLLLGAPASAEPEAETGNPPPAEDVDSEPVIHEVLVVTATARRETAFDLPFTVNTLSSRDLRSRRMVRTVPEALREVPGVMVQKTSHSQGSPYIRGFTGFRNLFLIDGLRLNNSVMREGPNQYWNTVEAFVLGSLETVSGPVSVLYGSEAIGGTVQAVTLRPEAIHRGSDFGGAALLPARHRRALGRRPPRPRRRSRCGRPLVPRRFTQGFRRRRGRRRDRAAAEDRLRRARLRPQALLGPRRR